MPDSLSIISELLDNLVENIDLLEDMADDPMTSSMLTDHESRLVRELSQVVSRAEGDWFLDTVNTNEGN